MRSWTIVVASILAAWVLGGLKFSPLRRIEWVLLALGLTQVHFASALVVVGWFFLLAWRGKSAGEVKPWKFDLLQIFLTGLTAAALIILIAAVKEGLLGDPEMFIRGNGSSSTSLQWFQPRGGNELPMPSVVSVSVWFYRLLMLAWALWLAAALIRWLKWAWTQFSEGGCWRRSPKKAKTPPSARTRQPDADALFRIHLQNADCCPPGCGDAGENAAVPAKCSVHRCVRGLKSSTI